MQYLKWLAYLVFFGFLLLRYFELVEIEKRMFIGFAVLFWGIWLLLKSLEEKHEQLKTRLDDIQKLLEDR